MKREVSTRDTVKPRSKRKLDNRSSQRSLLQAIDDFMKLAHKVSMLRIHKAFRLFHVDFLI